MSGAVSFLLAVLAGLLTGILSGFGVGGGSLLLIYLTGFAHVPQNLAQGVNLLYFLPTAAAALPSHVKNGCIEKKALLPAIGAGLLCSGAAAWLATAMDTNLLRKCFGVYLLIVGLRELFRPGKEKDSVKSS